MTTSLTYLFDPLCGWCYGASPVIQQLTQDRAISLVLAPTGLFAGGGRIIDADFAAFAWSNDLRIAKLTGQRFTDAYRQQVLGRSGLKFDSAAMTLAMTAVSLTDPSRELHLLQTLQEARYVQGLDTSDPAVVQSVLLELGLTSAVDRLTARDVALLSAYDLRLRNARMLMQTIGAKGVPALVLTNERGHRVLNGLHEGIDSVLRQIHV